MLTTKKQKSALVILATISMLYANISHSEIWIEERQRAELPKVLVSGARQKVVLTHTNKLGGKTTAEVVGGQTLSGHYFISSDSDKTISINLLDLGDVSNIKLKNFKLKYKGVTYNSFPAVGLPSPGNGEHVYIGFTAIIKPGATEGVRFPSYIIDVNEE